MRDDDEKNLDKQRASGIRELQNELFILQESTSDLQKNQERLEVDIKRARKLLADKAKELAEIKVLMAKQTEEVEKREEELREIEKQLLNHQGEMKRIENKMRELRHH